MTAVWAVIAVIGASCVFTASGLLLWRQRLRRRSVGRDERRRRQQRSALIAGSASATSTTSRSQRMSLHGRKPIPMTTRRQQQDAMILPSTGPAADFELIDYDDEDSAEAAVSDGRVALRETPSDQLQLGRRLSPMGHHEHGFCIGCVCLFAAIFYRELSIHGMVL